MKVLRLPWDEWGDTDVQLLMAADLHDRLSCHCGCGQWAADAHDPAKADQWQVTFDTCYARRSINAYIKANEPPDDAVPSVRFIADEQAEALSEHESLLARFPHLRDAWAATSQPQPEVDAASDDGDYYEQQDEQDE